jgi:hypothetical protein
MKLLHLAVSIVVYFSLTAYSQEYGRGILLDDDLFKNVTRAAPLMRGDFLNLPSKLSLRNYAPTPGNQGGYSTCAGWACGYSARTILYSLKKGLIDPLIDNNTFSPSFIYNQIRVDSTCEKGVNLIDALDLIKNTGALKMSDFDYSCDLEVEDDDNQRANDYKILEYREIFFNQSEDKILPTKKSISEYKPVVIAMDCPDSFIECRNLWEPKESDYMRWSQGHAIVVIGYDDEKYGGAFEIMNSWGSNWGDGGFGWIRYSDFSYFCLYGFELIDDIKSKEVEYNFAGSLSFRLNNGTYIKTKSNNGKISTLESFPSGTQFELRISNNQPAFVYCLSTDLTKRVSKLFPLSDNMSALLPYKGNNIAIPDESNLMMLDDIKGKTLFCFIYSNKELDINEIIRTLNKKKGSFQQIINETLEDDLIKNQNLIINTGDRIDFVAKGDGKSIVMIIVEFDHI